MVKRELAGVWGVGWAIAQSHLRFGFNIYDYEWDALVILDACRVDALRQVANEFDFLDTIGSKWSRGSTSKEWLDNTFVEKHRSKVAQTAYVTANSFARKLQWDKLDRLDYVLCSGSTLASSNFLEGLVKSDQLSASDFLYFDSLWDRMVGESSHHEIHPKVVTDRAIDAGRNTDCDRLIVHYMQPHHPFIYKDQLDDLHQNPFQYLDSQDARNKVWNAYIENLRFVLDYVSTLLDNLNAKKVVITSDHGELFGKYLKTHPVGVMHPNLRKVPWTTATATDNKTHQTDKYNIDDSLKEKEIKDRLADLGYL
ncbi:PglZ domain-containing protein [Haloplanus ruber]|uniref:PglZ domain-containing protein n=1 Tax=Haloplanus ruber TaxID=869892 RepID=A0ABD6CZ94_9EURY|nr:PglZ domain-containing protein [Haloplanus ruber]